MWLFLEFKYNIFLIILYLYIQFTIKYIEKELDEESREDFFRLKRVTDKKKFDKAAALREADKL